MSAPTVVYGHGVWVFVHVTGSGSKLKSYGWADISEILRFLHSRSSRVDGRMYPAAASVCWRAVAQESRMMLWAIFLLILRQANMWSPYRSCMHVHLHVGQLTLSNIGKRSFRLIAMSKDQLGNLLDMLLRFIPMSRYDVCGDKMLGSRWRCTGASICTVEYICWETRSLQNAFILLLRLCGDMADSKCDMRCSVGHFDPLQMALILGSRL